MARIQQQAGDTTSLERLLFPLAGGSFGTIADVLSKVHESIAAPVLVATLRAECGISVAEAVVKNVVWKLRAYAPTVTAPTISCDGLPSRLKVFQSYAPDNALVYLPARTGQCPMCGLGLVPQAARETINMKSGIGKAIGKSFHLQVFSLNAGIQNGSFTESKCQGCQRFFIGGWAFKKKRRWTSKRKLWFPC